jgi:hypothetical protein
MNATLNRIFLSFALIGLFTVSNAFAQKTKVQKLDKRKFAIEIRETTTEGKKFEKDVFEFTPKEVIGDYFESKLKVQTIHYKTVKDSSYTDDGSEVKYFQISGQEKSGKADEEYHIEAIVNGRDISGTIKLMKGDIVKKSWEFEGSQNN